MKAVITFGGTDPSGGAGIQADNRVFNDCGVFVFNVVTCVTAQNDRRYWGAKNVTPALVEKQFESVYSRYGSLVAGIKVSFLPSLRTARMVVKLLKRVRKDKPGVLILLDPILKTGTGKSIMAPLSRLPIMEDLLGLADILTPNLREFVSLFNLKGTPTAPELDALADSLGKRRPRLAVVVKSYPVAEGLSDLVIRNGTVRRVLGKRLDIPSFHGTGCLYSSRLFCHVLSGYSLEDAVAHAKQELEEFLVANYRYSLPYYGPGNPALFH